LAFKEFHEQFLVLSRQFDTPRRPRPGTVGETIPVPHVAHNSDPGSLTPGDPGPATSAINGSVVFRLWKVDTLLERI
jgi:hypothetical protein